MNGPLSILYTHNLRGDLDLLPRLYTFLKQLRVQVQRFEDNGDVQVCSLQPTSRRTLLVDVGGSCASEMWHCQVTGGRSTMIVLDAMGYDAINAGGLLAAGSREKLEGIVQAALIDEAHSVERDGLILTSTPQPGASGLQLVMQPQPDAILEGTALYPAALDAGQVGVLHVTGVSSPRLSAHHVFDMPRNMRPDATIAGTVDFVLSEARYFQKKQMG